jgi:hypothetical protein
MVHPKFQPLGKTGIVKQDDQRGWFQVTHSIIAFVLANYFFYFWPKKRMSSPETP